MSTVRPALSLEELEQRLARVPRTPLGCWPTPLHACPRLSTSWSGPNILIKRDDLSGLALGGNKVRNVEFRMARALEQGCDTVVIAREQYSNNARITAAAAARLGLRTVLLIPSEAPVELQGNRLLEEILGASVRVIPTTDPIEVRRAVQEVVERERAAGHRPYENDAERPDTYAVLGYVAGALELVRQCDEQAIEPAVLYVAAGFSQTGLLLGLRLIGRPWTVVGVAVELRANRLRPRQLAASADAADVLGVSSPLTDADFEIQEAPLGDGFQDLTAEARDVIAQVGRLEGLLLDPFYTAKVMVGLRDDIHRGRWPSDGVAIFVHTGGLPALFSLPDAYFESLVRS